MAGTFRPEQGELRAWYGQVLTLCAEPAFTRGDFLPLNPSNRDNPAFGRIGEESASGHWLYAFLRIDPETRQAFLVVVNLHGTEVMRDLRVLLSREGLSRIGRLEGPLRFAERVAADWSVTVKAESLVRQGLALPDLKPCAVALLEIVTPRDDPR